MKPSKQKILVTFSSGYGTTKEIAQEVAKVLENHSGLEVDCKQIDDCENIDDYDGLVIGTSLRADLLLANVRDFIVRYRWELSEKKTALFVASIASSTQPGAKSVSKNIRRQLEEHYSWVTPVSIGAFGGKVDFERINEVMQIFVKSIMKEKGLLGDGSYDGRNWQEIREWAEAVAQKFTAPVVSNELADTVSPGIVKK